MRLRLERECGCPCCRSRGDNHTALIGDLVAKLSIDEGRGITLRWLLGHGKNERWLTVAQAKRSVGEWWINVAWESPTPGEWLTRASSRFWEPRMSPRFKRISDR